MVPRFFHTSVYIKVPMKTNKVPRQCHRVNGFWKYRMEKMRLTNLRRVTTSVTVSEVHSVVRMNTPRMHTYLEDWLRLFSVNGQGRSFRCDSCLHPDMLREHEEPL